MNVIFSSWCRAVVLALAAACLTGGLASPARAAASTPPVRILNVRAKCLAFSPDGRTLALVNGEDRVELRDAATGKLDRWLPASVTPPTVLVFSADGRFLAGAGHAEVELWDLKEVRLVKTWQRLATYPCVAFSPDGKLLAFGTNDVRDRGSFVVWDLAAGRLKQTVAGPQTPTAVCFSPDGKGLVLATCQGPHMGWVNLFDLQTGARHFLDIQYRYADQLTFSADGKELLAGYPNFLAVRIPLGRQTDDRRNDLWPHQRVTVLAFAPGTSKIVVAIGKEIQVVDGRTRKTLLVLPGTNRRAGLTPDGKLLAVTGPDGIVEIIRMP